LNNVGSQKLGLQVDERRREKSMFWLEWVKVVSLHWLGGDWLPSTPYAKEQCQRAMPRPLARFFWTTIQASFGFVCYTALSSAIIDFTRTPKTKPSAMSKADVEWETGKTRSTGLRALSVFKTLALSFCLKANGILVERNHDVLGKSQSAHSVPD